MTESIPAICFAMARTHADATVFSPAQSCQTKPNSEILQHLQAIPPINPY
jgi:hypothetical protein